MTTLRLNSLVAMVISTKSPESSAIVVTPYTVAAIARFSLNLLTVINVGSDMVPTYLRQLLSLISLIPNLNSSSSTILSASGVMLSVNAALVQSLRSTMVIFSISIFEP
jgi:hypothetical protein